MAKEKVPKERPPACLPFGFPAMLRQAHPETPAHPARLGKPERDFIDQRLKTKDQREKRKENSKSTL
jgi:hypothetical protein